MSSAVMDSVAIIMNSKNVHGSIENGIERLQLLQTIETNIPDEVTNLSSVSLQTSDGFEKILSHSSETTATLPATVPDVRNSSTASVYPNSPVDEITRVCDGLYVSGFDVLSEKKIVEHDIRFIINATLEKPNLAIPNVDVLKLDILDMPSVNIRTHMDLCADTIHAVKSAGGQTLVHCALGISRSVTMCLAYLVKYEKQNLRDAYFALKRKRSRIHPNVGFWRQLISFEADTTGGSASVKMLSYPGGAIPSVYSVGGNRPMFATSKIRK